MARIFYSGLITDIKGSIRGSTFQQTRSAKIIRQRPLPSYKSTAKQQERQVAFSQLVRFWSVIDPGYQEEWETFADTYTLINKWGEEKSLNGYNWYLSVNGYRLLCGESRRDNPPTWYSPLAVPDYSYAIRSTIVKVTFDTFAHPTHYLLIYTSPPVKKLGTNDRKLLRLTKFVDRGTSGLIDFTSEYIAAHNLSWPPSGSDPYIWSTCAILSVRWLEGLASPYTLQSNWYAV